MIKKTIKDVDVSEKRVLVRVDFNVPIQDGKIIDDMRIRAALPTIQYLIQHGSRVILLTHLGRPDGFVVESLRTNPLAAHLANLLGAPVAKVNNCIGPEVQEAVKVMEPGQVLMLENVRFHPGEMVNDPQFAAQLASCAELFVNDAFATIHRNHASMVAITHYLPAVAGLLVESELGGLHRIKASVHPPIMVLLGGIRLVDKARFIDDQLERGNRILLGGGLANTFLKAKGVSIGQSQIEPSLLGLAREFLAGSPHQLDLPVDVVVAEKLSANAPRKTVSVNHIPPTGCIVDIGPETIQRYCKILSSAKVVIWNGPMGAIEYPEFSAGSIAMARKIASLDQAIKIIGGGETLVLLDRVDLAAKMDYVSTGGPSFLAALSNEPLLGIRALQNKEVAEVPKGG